MSLPSYVGYRGVNMITNEGLSISIKFFKNKIDAHIVWIAINGTRLFPLSFKDLPNWIIFKALPNGFRRMQLAFEYEKDLCLFLRETEEQLSFIDFYSRYSINFSRMRRNLLHFNRFSEKPKALKWLENARYAEGSHRRVALKKRMKRPANLSLTQEFIPIDSQDAIASRKSGASSNSPDNGAGVLMLALRSSSEEELSQYGQHIDFPQDPSVQEPVCLKSALKKADSPARRLHVSFGDVRNVLPNIIEKSEDSSTASSPEHARNYVSSPERSVKKKFSQPLSIWSLWLNACIAPLGKWGLAVLLVGVVGAVLATPASIAFYAATSMTVVGAAAVGISLFRTHRKATLRQQDNLHGCASMTLGSA